MVKRSEPENYDAAVIATVGRVADWLKFAEAKNAALLAFASAWIVGLINLLSSDKTLPRGFQTAAALALPLFAIAAVLTIVSLLPRLRPHKITGDPAAPRNMLFFGDIADLELSEFRQTARKSHRTADGRTSNDYVSDLENQAWINSRIAKRKYRLFNWGAIFTLVAMAILLIPALSLAYCTIVGLVRHL